MSKKMDSKKLAVLVVVGLLALGGFGMMSFSNRGGTTQKNSNQQQGESYDDMMTRMHPNRQVNNDMSGHHRNSPISDNSNKNMDTIEFSEAIGKPAPDFTLTQQDGSTFTLSDYNDKTVVLFFNEGAMCYPACWSQIAALGSDERFNNDGVVTVSVVIDSKAKWDKIIRSQPKYGTGTIVFDTNTAVSRAYGMLNVPSSMHKGSNPGHTYLIIKNGIISYVLDDPKMALNNDVVASKL